MFSSFTLLIRPMSCAAGDVLPLTPVAAGSDGAETFFRRVVARSIPLVVPAGTMLRRGPRSFRAEGRAFVPGLARPCPLLRALTAWEEADDFQEVFAVREGYAVACVTLSDRGWRGEREDRSGPCLLELARSALPVCHEQLFLLPDDPEALRAMTLELAVGQGYDLILACGGTGLAPRDLTPEALLPVLDRRVPGLEHAMMRDSLNRTPRAALSRALAGTVGRTLVLALPGSVDGARDNLAAVLPVLPHALEKLAGDPADCGGWLP